MQKYGIAVFREAEALALSLASELNYLADDVAMDSREALYEPSERAKKIAAVTAQILLLIVRMVNIIA